MNCTRTASTRAILSEHSAASILKILNGSQVTARVSGPASLGFLHQSSNRSFSTSKPALIKEFFPAPENPNIRLTGPAWQHPVYTRAQMDSIQIAHRETKTWSDYVALTMVRILRWGLDTASGYKHDEAVALGHKDPEAAHKKYAMTERKYLVR